MKYLTKLIIVRHGQSLGNLTATFLGHTDLDLSDLGYKQAAATAEHLKNEKIDTIYSSDLKRAANTAIPHAKIRDLDVIYSQNLREMYVGEWENRTKEDIINIWGREMFEKQWFDNFGLFTFPGGENTIDSGKRFLDEVLRISSENIGKTVLIAAHAGVIRSFWSIISNIDPKDIASSLPFPSNASYSIAYFDGEKLIPENYSCDSHLESVGITKVNLR